MPDPIDDTVETPSDETEDQSAVEEGQEEFPQDDEAQEEDVSMEDRILHKMQSWQGRREKERDDKFFDKMAGLLNQQPAQQQPPPQMGPVYQTEDPEPDPDLDVRGWYDWRQRQDSMRAVQTQQAADQAYFGTINNPNVRHKDEAIHEAALKEIQHNQNIDPYTGQQMTPSADAMLNYNNAIRKVLESQVALPEDGPNPLANNQPPPQGQGVSQPAQQTRTVASMPRNLSAESQKLIMRGGWNADKVRKVLAKDV